jgi:hypothetical protein
MNRRLDQYIGNFVVLLAVVSYFQLLRFNAIPFSIRIGSQLVVVALIIVLIIFRIIYHPEVKIRMNFATPVLLMILGSIPSYFIAKSYQNQDFIITVFASRLIGFYLVYFFAHLYKVSIKFILQVIIIVGLVAVGLYFLQLSYYPKVILDIGMIKGRGTIRLFVGGMLCTQAAYFYFLNQFFSKNKLTYLFLSLLCLSIFILQGTRQLIFGLAFLTLINLLFTKRIQSRFLITLILSMAVISVFLVFREIFGEIYKVSANQAQYMGNGIRIKAARFFLTSFMPNKWAYLFGNGDSGLGSLYDQKIMLYALKYGFYIADIGILGDYIKYGVVFILAAIYMLVKVLTIKVGPEVQFLKYYILSQCFTLVAGNGIFGGADIVLILILYVFDVNRAEILERKKLPELNPDSN